MPAHLLEEAEKYCEVCGSRMRRWVSARGKRVSHVEFSRRRFCSRECGILGRSARRIIAPNIRFEKNIDTSLGHDACWPWKGNCDPKGYGRFYASGRMQASHRFAWEMANGPIPNDLLVLHKCDNPPCCNPSHLFLGTHADNSLDMAKKLRSTTRFSVEQIRNIRAMRVAGAAYRTIADAFGTRPGNVHKICARKSFKWVD